MNIENILHSYSSSKNRIIFLDYDGTLVNFHNDPMAVSPDDELLNILDDINKHNKLVIISGRDHKTFEQWFKNKPYTFICEHGLMIKEDNKDWKQSQKLSPTWKNEAKEILNKFTNKYEGSFIEEKGFSIAWHYRPCKIENELEVVNKIFQKLDYLLRDNSLNILDGDKTLEIRPDNINKGISAINIINNNDYDFILAIGDDVTDEDLFKHIPSTAFTIKVGNKETIAKYRLENVKNVRNLLKELSK